MSRHDEGNVKRVTRYVIHEQDFDDTKSSYTTRSNYTTRTQKEREEEPEYVKKDIYVRAPHKEESSPRRKQYWETDDQNETKIVIRSKRETTEPNREERDLTITRVEERDDEQRGEREVASPRDAYWERDRDRDWQRYSRTVDYYGQPQQQPQTIIIRQDPVIIRQLVHRDDYDDGYEMVDRSEYDQERSVARREEPRDVEKYSYYQREEYRNHDDPRDRRRSRDGDRRERADSIDQWDSISNDGRRRGSDFDDDQSMVYVKKKRVTTDYDSREASPDRRKNLAAGAIAGVGAAELIRSHRRKEGRETSHGIGRVGRDVGAGALGALAAEGIQRARSLHRERSRRRDSRDRDSDHSEYSDRERRHGRRRSRRRSGSRSRSRSESRSKLKTLGVIGLGAAAVAAAATIASKKIKENNNKEEPDRRRSRSRRRRGSVQSLEALENDSTADDARNPKHRNSRIAAAGAVGAAGAALIERARNQSKKGEGRSRSRSRIRQGLPIAAAGLGTAALAGLYEKNKAKREAEKIQHEQKHEARHEREYSREDSHTRSGSAYRGDEARETPRLSYFSPDQVSYGNEGVYGGNFGPNYYGGPRAAEYESQAMVPAEAPRGATRSSRSPSRSVSRDRGRRAISPSDSEHHDNRRRSRDGLAMAAAAAAGGIAASEYERRKQEKKERKARKREQDRGGYDRHEDGYEPQHFQTPTPPPAHDPYATASGFYSSTSPLPPPPGQLPQQQPYTNNGTPQVFPNSTTPQPQPAMAPQAVPQNIYQPPPNDTYGPAPDYNHPNDPYGAQNFPQSNPSHPEYDQSYRPSADPHTTSRSRGADENVSAGSPFSQNAPSNQQQAHPDGVSGQSRNQPPSINIIPPSATPSAPTASNPNLTVPSTYEPPTEGEETSYGKHVQFATSPTPEPSRTRTANSAQTTDTEAMSPDDRRQRRHRTEIAQGYEASEDTDTSPADDPRSRAYDTRLDRDRTSQGNRSRSNSNRERERDRDRGYDRDYRDRERDRRKDQERGYERSHEQDRDPDRNRDSHRPSRNRSRRSKDDDGHDSDATIELEPRFDEKGRKKPERGEDPVADKIDDILAGKGAAGKVLGNFVDGLLGGEKNKGSDDKDRRGKGRRD